MEVVHIILQNFAQHLTSHNASTSTVKNYLADIGLFFRFLESHDQPVSLLTLPHQLSDSNISLYHQYLISNFPSSTVKRRISSLNKFITFANSSHPVSSFQSPVSAPKPHFNYTFALFVLLTIFLSIISGFVASQLAPRAPLGLVDPATTSLLP